VSVELPDVTPDQVRAMKECRFATVNVARDQAFWIDADKARVEAVGFGAGSYERARGVWEYEGRTSHPQMIAAVEKHLGLARG
jgi:hypothetical protein